MARRQAARLLPLLALFLAVALLTDPGDRADEEALLVYGEQLLEGDYAHGPPTNAVAFLWHGPGVPLLLAPLIALDAPLVVIRLILGPLVAFGAVIMFERLLSLHTTPRWALAGAYALGLYLPFLGILHVVHKEPLALLLVASALYFATLHARGGSRRDLLLAGGALAWLVLTRVEYGWVVIAGLLLTLSWWALRRASRRARRLAALQLVALAACLPWLAYNYSETGKPLYWGNAGGLSLYWMSHTGKGQRGDWNAVRTVFEDPRLAGHRPLFSELRRVSPLERDARLQAIAWRNITADPAGYAGNVVENASRMLFGFPFRDRPVASSTVLYALLNLALLALLAVALARLHGARGSREAALSRAEGLAALAWAGLAFGVHLWASAEPRMLTPLVPALVLVGIVGISLRARRGTPPATLPARSSA